MDLFKYIFNVKCIDKFYHFFFLHCNAQWVSFALSLGRFVCCPTRICNLWHCCGSFELDWSFSLILLLVLLPFLGSFR